ncbi:uncharacterized protein [Littorina saxatilis]|uniref:uncharacterized protein n=1 Tax=Littorina saxatilis TaxID=31220 RepID=UPI0038B656F6
MDIDITIIDKIWQVLDRHHRHRLPHPNSSHSSGCCQVTTASHTPTLLTPVDAARSPPPPKPQLFSLQWMLPGHHRLPHPNSSHPSGCCQVTTASHTQLFSPQWMLPGHHRLPHPNSSHSSGCCQVTTASHTPTLLTPVDAAMSPPPPTPQLFSLQWMLPGHHRLPHPTLLTPVDAARSPPPPTPQLFSPQWMLPGHHRLPHPNSSHPSGCCHVTTASHTPTLLTPVDAARSPPPPTPQLFSPQWMLPCHHRLPHPNSSHPSGCCQVTTASQTPTLLTPVDAARSPPPPTPQLFSPQWMLPCHHRLPHPNSSHSSGCCQVTTASHTQLFSLQWMLPGHHRLPHPNSSHPSGCCQVTTASHTPTLLTPVDAAMSPPPPTPQLFSPQWMLPGHHRLPHPNSSHPSGCCHVTTASHTPTLLTPVDAARSPPPPTPQLFSLQWMLPGHHRLPHPNSSHPSGCCHVTTASHTPTLLTPVDAAMSPPPPTPNSSHSSGCCQVTTASQTPTLLTPVDAAMSPPPPTPNSSHSSGCCQVTTASHTPTLLTPVDAARSPPPPKPQLFSPQWMLPGHHRLPHPNDLTDRCLLDLTDRCLLDLTDRCLLDLTDRCLLDLTDRYLLDVTDRCLLDITDRCLLDLTDRCLLDLTALTCACLMSLTGGDVAQSVARWICIQLAAVSWKLAPEP